MHSRITFYVYAKIGQVSEGRSPPLDPPLAPKVRDVVPHTLQVALHMVAISCNVRELV